MAIVKHFDKEYSCTTAIKGNDYVHLLNENGKMIVAFDGVSDFSSFSITDGSWATPTPENNCYVAVIKDDGTIGKGGHRCCDVVTTQGDSTINGTLKANKIIGAVYA